MLLIYIGLKEVKILQTLFPQLQIHQFLKYTMIKNKIEKINCKTCKSFLKPHAIEV